jgi:ribose 5-phosphate isomerase A
MDQNELKRAVARAAIDHLTSGALVGVGSGSTVNLFIEELGRVRDRVAGAVSSSEASSQRLRAQGIEVLDLNEVLASGREIGHRR